MPSRESANQDDQCSQRSVPRSERARLLPERSGDGYRRCDSLRTAEGVELISEACAAEISVACHALEQRFKAPERLSGQAPMYTPEALDLNQRH